MSIVNNSEWKLNKVLCTASTISDTCAANSLHLISPAGRDYTPVTTDLTFNSTNAAIPQTVAIPIRYDLLLEGSEVFNVTLTTNNSNVMLLPNLTTVAIEDVEGKLKEKCSCLQQQQPGTVTHSRISPLLISRCLSRPRVASRYSVQTSSYFKQLAN